MKPKSQLTKLVIKPTLACTAACNTCSTRRELHKSLIGSRSLLFSEWEKILSDANDLGTKRLTISGGEPTLYRRLIELVKIGKSYKWFVGLNTNGSLITEEYAKKLLDAGLDQIRISLYSHIPQIHDKIRNKRGLWEKATKAVRIFSVLGKKHPRFNLMTMFLICRDNYKLIPQIINFCYDIGSSTIQFSYLEGDFEKRYLLNEKEICELKNEIIPKATNVCEKLDKRFMEDVINFLKNLYSDKIAEITDFAKGIYHPENRNFIPCAIPKMAALILANGDVHPCNVVEYTHKPVMGNVFKENLADIWLSERWDKFRNEYFCNETVNYCRLCPMTIHTKLVFPTSHNTPL